MNKIALRGLSSIASGLRFNGENRLVNILDNGVDSARNSHLFKTYKTGKPVNSKTKSINNMSKRKKLMGDLETNIMGNKITAGVLGATVLGGLAVGGYKVLKNKNSNTSLKKVMNSLGSKLTPGGSIKSTLIAAGVGSGLGLAGLAASKMIANSREKVALTTASVLTEKLIAKRDIKNLGLLVNKLRAGARRAAECGDMARYGKRVNQAITPALGAVVAINNVRPLRLSSMNNFIDITRKSNIASEVRL